MYPPSSPEIKGKLSLRASVTSELVLEDVRLPADAVLPGARGLSCPLGCLPAGFCPLAARLYGFPTNSPRTSNSCGLAC